MRRTALLLAAGAAPARGAVCTSGAPFCQTHLALGTAAGDLRVGWVSNLPHAPTAPVVEWGAAPALPLPRAANATTETYAAADLCNATTCVPNPDYPGQCLTGWEDPGLVHHAALRGLAEGTDIWYRVGDAGSGVYGNVTGPVHIGPRRGPGLSSFAAFGDMGAFAYNGDSGIADKAVTDALQKALPTLDAVVHVGDLAYANSGEFHWRLWQEEVAPVAGTIPWMVACGNHDCLTSAQPHAPWWGKGDAALLWMGCGGDGGECGVPYNTRFWMPGDPALIAGWRESRGGSRNNLFYSFDIGAVHFALLSSEHDCGNGSAQLAWLSRDLGGLDRGVTPFVVVGLHRPLYTSTLASDFPETIYAREAIEPLLLKHHVTVVLSGHYHQYERTCPIVRGACAPGGTVHMTVGNAGPSDSLAWGDQPAWSVVREMGKYGFTRFDVANETHMRASLSDAATGAAVDELWLSVGASAFRGV